MATEQPPSHSPRPSLPPGIHAAATAGATPPPSARPQALGQPGRLPAPRATRLLPPSTWVPTRRVPAPPTPSYTALRKSHRSASVNSPGGIRTLAWSARGCGRGRRGPTPVEDVALARLPTAPSGLEASKATALTPRRSPRPRPDRTGDAASTRGADLHTASDLIAQSASVWPP